MEGFLITLTMCVTFYKFVELFARRKERKIILDKINFENPNIDLSGVKLPSIGTDFNIGKFTSLRIGIVMVGLALGLIVGVILNSTLFPMNGDISYRYNYYREIVMFASPLLFGGIALLTSFLIEQKMRSNPRELLKTEL